ncbi:unnamed protein product [Closterium sp. NIES-65]|nr:unnamed protein product [Closterium sp. NIES-65]
MRSLQCATAAVYFHPHIICTCYTLHSPSILLLPVPFTTCPLPSFPSALSLPFQVCNFSSQQVAHTGVAVAGTWSAQAAAALHPTHPQLKVAVAGDMECTGSSCSPPNPPAAKFLPCLSTPVLSCFLCCISCFFLLQTQASGSAKASSHRPVFSKVEGRGVGVNTATFSRLSRVAVQVAVVGGEGGSTPLGWGGRESIGLGRLSQGHVGSGEGGSIALGWDGKGEYGAGLSEASSLRHHGALHGSGRWS